jgi:hypothetical protein
MDKREREKKRKKKKKIERVMLLEALVEMFSPL